MRLGAGYQLIDGAGAVEKTVVAVAMEVNERLGAHEIPFGATKSFANTVKTEKNGKKPTENGADNG